MALLAWMAAPLLADHLSGPGALSRALIMTLTVGMVWQFVLVSSLVAREQASVSALLSRDRSSGRRVIRGRASRRCRSSGRPKAGTELHAGRYAVIVDEAHSSQTGEAAKDLKQVLGANAEQQLQAAEALEASGEAASDPQDELIAALAARGRQDNVSFFAFTATPKARTLELFGTRRVNDTYGTFHLYSMKQAIEEGFILDVLTATRPTARTGRSPPPR